MFTTHACLDVIILALCLLTALRVSVRVCACVCVYLYLLDTHSQHVTAVHGTLTAQPSEWKYPQLWQVVASTDWREREGAWGYGVVWCGGRGAESSQHGVTAMMYGFCNILCHINININIKQPSGMASAIRHQQWTLKPTGASKYLTRTVTSEARPWHPFYPPFCYSPPLGHWLDGWRDPWP